MPWVRAPKVNYDEQESFRWPFWEVDLPEEDLFGDLSLRFNTMPHSAWIQDPKAFHQDVCAIAFTSATRQEFLERMQARRDERLAELEHHRKTFFWLMADGYTELNAKQMATLAHYNRYASYDALVGFWASLLKPDAEGEKPSLDDAIRNGERMPRRPKTWRGRKLRIEAPPVEASSPQEPVPVFPSVNQTALPTPPLHPPKVSPLSDHPLSPQEPSSPQKSLSPSTQQSPSGAQSSSLDEKSPLPLEIPLPQESTLRQESPLLQKSPLSEQSPLPQESLSLMPSSAQESPALPQESLLAQVSPLPKSSTSEPPSPPVSQSPSSPTSSSGRQSPALQLSLVPRRSASVERSPSSPRSASPQRSPSPPGPRPARGEQAHQTFLEAMRRNKKRAAAMQAQSQQNQQINRTNRESKRVIPEPEVKPNLGDSGYVRECDSDEADEFLVQAGFSPSAVISNKPALVEEKQQKTRRLGRAKRSRRGAAAKRARADDNAQPLTPSVASEDVAAAVTSKGMRLSTSDN